MRPPGSACTGEKYHLEDSLRQIVAQREVASEFIVAPCRNHEFDLVLAIQRIQIFHLKGVWLP